MNYSFHHEAATEFEHAIDFYEEYEPGLGEAFSEEVLPQSDGFSDLPKVGRNIPTVRGDAFAAASPTLLFIGFQKTRS